MVNNKKSIKKIIIAAISLILVVSIAVACAIIFVPVKLDVDIDSIEPVGTTVRIIEASENNPVSIYKEDSDGEISDEAFKILSFTDTHLDANKEKGACTMKYFIANIQKEKPDLVVIDGDTVTGVINRKRAEMFAEVMEKLGVYWITTLGNHEGDNALSLSREDFVELYSSYPHCLIESGDKYDEVIAIGPLMMMKFVCKLTKEYDIKTIVSMNPVMIDGTGMCGGCRLSVGGKTKFACVDGPDFDGHEVDFDVATNRGRNYREWEKHKYEETCNLFRKEIK